MYSWIAAKRLAMGQMITHQNDLRKLDREGIEVIINLQTHDYQSQYDLSGFEYYHLPVADFSVPSDATVERFLRIIKNHHEEDQAVYVHCTAGCGRSGTMVAIWLTTQQQWTSLEELVGHLRSLRACAIETDEQLAYVNRFLT